VGPIGDRRDHGFERQALVAQVVMNPDGMSRQDRPHDDPFAFELFEALREQAIAETRDGGGDVAEAHRAVDRERAQDGAAPTTADEFDRMEVERAERLAVVVDVHAEIITDRKRLDKDWLIAL